MANRSQRRHPAPPMRVLARNPKAQAPNLGNVVRKIDPPEPVGTLTVPEATEIKGRNSLLEFVAAELKTAQERLRHFEQLQRVAAQERAYFTRGLCRQRGLPDDADYNLDPESGVIVKVAELVPATPPAEENGQATDAPDEPAVVAEAAPEPEAEAEAEGETE